MNNMNVRHLEKHKVMPYSRMFMNDPPTVGIFMEDRDQFGMGCKLSKEFRYFPMTYARELYFFDLELENGNYEGFIKWNVYPALVEDGALVKIDGKFVMYMK